MYRVLRVSVLLLCSAINFPVHECTSNEYIQNETVNDGYFLDALSEPLNGVENAQFSDGPEVLECPSSNVITTRYKCNMNGEWVDCSRKHCCKDYTFIAGRCVLKDEDPCSMGLCEQQCTVYLQRIICTCYDGYKFHPDNQKNGIKPFCVDVNECLVNNGDCEHECINETGGYRCACKQGFVLREDNRTCITTTNMNGVDEDDYHRLDAANAGMTATYRNVTELPARRDRCYASCDTVSRLHDKLKVLSEKVSALSTAIRLASFASGPPGPAGPPGPPGQPGPRGFPGAEGSNNNAGADNEGRTYFGGTGANNGYNHHGHGHTAATGDGGLSANTRDYTYSILDAFVPLPGDETTHCRCKRGPQGTSGAPGTRGPQGLPGERGPRGPKGPRGSFDFLLLVLADLRHDLQQLQNKVYTSGEKPTKFDIHAALDQKHFKSKQKLLKQYKSLEVFGTQAVMEMNVDGGGSGNGNSGNNRNDPLLLDHQMTSTTSSKDIKPTTITTSTTSINIATTSATTTASTIIMTPAKHVETHHEEEEDEGEGDTSGEMTYEDYL